MGEWIDEGQWAYTEEREYVIEQSDGSKLVFVTWSASR